MNNSSHFCLSDMCFNQKIEDSANYHDHPLSIVEWNDNCCICLSPILRRSILPECTHEFCFKCIAMWLQHSNKCPLCRHKSFCLVYDIQSPNLYFESRILSHFPCKFDFSIIDNSAVY
uniref:E3 ubiquitin-protein ligase Topors (Trinotate prediction) n=1 Tax=Henneguya salminicola TaxID=69463 RepID=A0A6G3MJ97_HENSL